MPGTNSKPANEWPLTTFHFEVDLGPDLKKVMFQEVSGLDAESQVIEFRSSNSPMFAAQKMPGIVNYGSVTMKRGVFVNDNTFWEWHKHYGQNTLQRNTITIKLLDEQGKTAMQWALKNAWPKKIISTDLKSDGNEVAVESIEIAHEGISISDGK